MSERGFYRSIPCGLLDDPNFHKLPERHRWLFFVLTMNMCAAGIDVRYSGELIERLVAHSGAPADQVRQALDELDHNGWIKREDNVLWVVGQLQRDPHMRATDSKHRKNVQRHVAGLPPMTLVRLFIESNKEWFPFTEGSLMGLAWAFEESPNGPVRKKRKRSKRQEQTLPAGADDGDVGREVDALSISSPTEPHADPVLDDSFNPTNWVEMLGNDFKTLTRGMPNYGKIGKYLKPLVDEYGLDCVRPAWQTFCRSESRRYGPQYFVEHFGDYEPKLIDGSDERAIIAALEIRT